PTAIGLPAAQIPVARAPAPAAPPPEAPGASARSTTRSAPPPPPPPLSPPPTPKAVAGEEVEEELNASDLREDGEGVADPLGLGVGKPPGTPVQNAPFPYGSDDDDEVILPQEGLTKHLQGLTKRLQGLTKHLPVVREALARH